MAASMGPNFTGHPASMAHQAVTGHPMGPCMPPNTAQQGGPSTGIPQQFASGHMAVSGPGGQVNPALMSAMLPGTNPHHLQHLNTVQQQQLFHQHQQQQQQLQRQFHNPSAIAAMRQHQLLQHQQHQARQVLMAQQSMNAGMGVGNGLPMGMPVSQLNPQQLQQLRNSGRMGPSQHPQSQVTLVAQQFALQHQAQQQQQAQHQQQQAAAQHAAHNQQQISSGSNQVPQMAMNAQNMTSAQQAQMSGNGSNPMGPQQQVGQSNQSQPPSQFQGQPQQPGQQAQKTPQQSSQAGTPGPTAQQTPSQTPAPTPVQTNSLQQGNIQGQPQQPHSQAQQQHIAVAAQQLALHNTLLQQRRDGMRNQCLLKLFHFSELLGSFPGKDDLGYWNAFVGRFFSVTGVLRHALYVGDAQEMTDKQYEISYPAIPRYFHTHFGSGVRNIQLVLDKPTLDRPIPGDSHCIENGRASMVYWFETGSHLVATGKLRVQFDAELKMELFEFLTMGQEEFLSRKQVIDAAKPAHLWFKEWHKVNAQNGKSPEMSKKSKGKQFRSPQMQPPDVLVDLPDSAAMSKGVTVGVHQFLEIVEVIGQMNPLFAFCHNNQVMGAYAALDQYVSTYIMNSAPTVKGQGVPQGLRTPNFGQFPIGTSPATAHTNLPGSPHMGSPAPGHVKAPVMQLQPSQPGTSSSGPSANTSPASNKRRRPSGAIKEEDVSGAPTPVGSGPQVNGTLNRPSKPLTPRMPKRIKGNPS